MSQQSTAIRLNAKQALWWILVTIQPLVVEVDGVPAKGTWGDQMVPVAPGSHRVSVSWKLYWLLPVQRATLDVTVDPSAVVSLRYKIAWLVFLPGRLYLDKAPYAEVFKALSSDKPLQILEWWHDPLAHFPPQKDGDLVQDGVCSLFIAEKLDVTQPTCGEHLKVLSRAGLLRSKRIKQWVFYKRDEERINEVKRLLSGDW